ncbi:hypothetical protein BV375_28540 [Nostoc sp. 106C]|nr:hypothetical protein BV375_28540 [Nostoc sp. 106C]
MEFIDIPFTTVGRQLTEKDKAVSDYINQIQKHFYDEHEQQQARWNTQDGCMRATRELIYDLNDGQPIFHIIGYSFNVRRGELQISHLLDLIIEGDSSEEIDDSICNTLALAHIHEVPVYPNTDELAEKLAEYYKDMMTQGFTMPDGEGSRQRYILTKSRSYIIEESDFLEKISLTEPIYAAELIIIRSSIQKEISKLSEVKKFITSLERAIKQLEFLLNKKERNEYELQSYLTQNPILLGLEYRNVIPKYKLGAEYEMDYALQRSSGLVDVMEIEASSLPLFNKNGDPSHYLIHAEQQVLDWLAWIERNHPYARESLPGITKPLGFVVIGRSSDLSDKGRNRLNQRNNLFRGNLQVLTYDDVLEKARTTYKVLTGIEV